MTNQQLRDSLSLEENFTKTSSSFVFKIFDGLASMSYVKKIVIRGWYQYLSKLDRDATITFMNYGYEPLDSGAQKIELRPEDQANRYCIQLYQRAAGNVELRGKDLLEVGCGRGGGASFMMRYFEPRSVSGVDFSSRAVAFCQSHYQQEGLSFFQSDAEKLPFAPGSFDAVVNIESSHCYNSVERFLREVVRVLRPGGHFLFADFRQRDAVPVLREQLRRTGMRVVEEEQIAANVVKALELDDERKLALIESKAPKFMRGRIQEFAGLAGSPVYKRFLTGEWEYLRFVLQKESSTAPVINQ